MWLPYFYGKILATTAAIFYRKFKKVFSKINQNKGFIQTE